jgi:hypothetical protein
MRAWGPGSDRRLKNAEAGGAAGAHAHESGDGHGHPHGHPEAKERDERRPSLGIVGASRIEGIGEQVRSRMLAGGLKSFTFDHSGHAGVVEADGTIQLCLASGEDLTITFPAEGSGEDPAPDGSVVCPTCGIKHS